jgi:hypothetical protein
VEHGAINQTAALTTKSAAVFAREMREKLADWRRTLREEPSTAGHVVAERITFERVD